MAKNQNALTLFLSFCREVVPGHGEDSFCHSFSDRAGLVGVFDGCGGAGARSHAYYSDMTEAYMASRLCAGVFYDAFRKADIDALTGQSFTQAVTAGVKTCLSRFQPPKEPGGMQIRGSMVRTLPTTAAAALILPGDGEELQLSAIWAGDSRVYLLDEQGLAQLTADDTSVPDPMDNLYEDGVLRNLLCSDRPFQLHCRTLAVKPPFVVFAATDGCFGYLSTPMEFEGLMLGSLMSAKSVDQWETELADAIGAVAGDDHSLCLAAYGYRDLTALKRWLAPRYQFLQENYLAPLSGLGREELAPRKALWASYRDQYSRWMEGATV